MFLKFFKVFLLRHIKTVNFFHPQNYNKLRVSQLILV